LFVTGGSCQDDKFSASWGEIRFHLYLCTTPTVQQRTRGASASSSSSAIVDETKSRSASYVHEGLASESDEE